MSVVLFGAILIIGTMLLRRLIAKIAKRRRKHLESSPVRAIR